ncbi:hypothetical protein, partial [Flavobacterium lindanitolerans]|uniref:hypothetical protein n=1 Tax=Flavobacterium lindanitolerans TaxID=428988 RepID=UPI002808C374
NGSADLSFSNRNLFPAIFKQKSILTILFIKPKRKTNIPKPLLRSQVLSKVQKTRHLHLVFADRDRLSFFLSIFLRVMPLFLADFEPAKGQPLSNRSNSV